MNCPKQLSRPIFDRSESRNPAMDLASLMWYDSAPYHPAAWLRFFNTHCLERLKWAMVDCIVMAACVVCAALLTLLLGM
jgi:hypothetical protein